MSSNLLNYKSPLVTNLATALELQRNSQQDTCLMVRKAESKTRLSLRTDCEGMNSPRR